MSPTAIDGNYAIILPVMKQGREGNRKEKNKEKTRSKATVKIFTYANAKKIYYFTNVIRTFAVVSLV